MTNLIFNVLIFTALSLLFIHAFIPRSVYHNYPIVRTMIYYGITICACVLGCFILIDIFKMLFITKNVTNLFPVALMILVLFTVSDRK